MVTTGEDGVWTAARSIRAGVLDRVGRLRPNDLPLRVVKTIEMPQGAQSIAVGYGAAWVVNTKADTVTRIDLVSGAQSTVNGRAQPAWRSRWAAAGSGWQTAATAP